MYKSKRIMYQKSNLHNDFCMDEISEYSLINLFYRARLNRYRNSKMFISSLKCSPRNKGMGYISNFVISVSIKVFNRGYKDVKNMACISTFEEIGEFEEEWRYGD